MGWRETNAGPLAASAGVDTTLEMLEREGGTTSDETQSTKGSRNLHHKREELGQTERWMNTHTELY